MHDFGTELNLCVKKISITIQDVFQMRPNATKKLMQFKQ